MKWFSHRLTTGGAAIVLGGGPIGAILAYAGSTLPDVLDGKPPPESLFFGEWRKRQWQKHHRGTTHWVGWYLIGMAALWWYSRSHHWPLLLKLNWLFAGAIGHLVGDAMTPGGIPVMPWKNGPRATLNLFKTGSPLEYLFVLAFMSLVVAWEMHRYAI